jgi:hypothetical protein
MSNDADTRTARNGARLSTGDCGSNGVSGPDHAGLDGPAGKVP